MYGLATGISDTDNINYCPRCGKEIFSKNSDGGAKCECGFSFFVIEADDSELEDDLVEDRE